MGNNQFRLFSPHGRRPFIYKRLVFKEINIKINKKKI